MKDGHKKAYYWIPRDCKRLFWKLILQQIGKEEIYELLYTMAYQNEQREYFKNPKQEWDWHSIQSCPTQKIWGLEESTGEFFQTFKEELTPMLLKLYHKIERDGMFQNSFYKMRIIQI